MASFLALAALTSALMGGQEAPDLPVTSLPDIEITASRNRDMATQFVRNIAAPAGRRGLGRWRNVCAAVANLQRDAAQPIADQIGFRAAELGIEVQSPGCDPNIIVIFAADSNALAAALVQAEPHVFTQGGNGIDWGQAALRHFQNTDRPIRWWTLSVPINSDTGRRAVRVAGDAVGGPVPPRIARTLGCNPRDCAFAGTPVIQSNIASRLNSQVVDQIYKSIVIVDIDRVSGLSAQQVGDYIAMVSLAQINPQADIAAFDTVLNLFDMPDQLPGMSEWDRSYLWALYNSHSRRRGANAQADDVANLINRSPNRVNACGEPHALNPPPPSRFPSQVPRRRPRPQRPRRQRVRPLSLPTII